MIYGQKGSRKNLGVKQEVNLLNPLNIKNEFINLGKTILLVITDTSFIASTNRIKIYSKLT